MADAPARSGRPALALTAFARSEGYSGGCKAPRAYIPQVFLLFISAFVGPIACIYTPW